MPLPIVACPVCRSQMSFDVLIAEDAPRAALNAIVDAHPAGETFVKPMLRYIGLFAPAKSQMSHSRIAALVMELAPMVQSAQVQRDGRVWPCPIEYWARGFEQMLALRDLGRLNLPLKSHGYLLEVLIGSLEKSEARQEAYTERQRQGHSGLGTPAARAAPQPELPPDPPTETPRQITAVAADSLAAIKNLTKRSSTHRIKEHPMNNQQIIPAGYVKDARGRLVPESMVAPIDQLRDQTVKGIVEEAKALQARMASFKGRAFADIETFVTTSNEQYDVKVGGAKGNVTLMTFDAKYKIVRQIAEHIRFDERLQAAKELIDECLREWTAGSDDKIKVLINEAFQVDKEGNVNTGRILGLRRLAIDDAKWTKAMRAIADSIRVTGTKPYVRIYERDDETGDYSAISLDIASI